MSVSYIGSKISLISKAEIRYEGTLHAVDVNESTITLAKVRTFGTENRPAQHPMPPRNEIFEFIIFKATDIKDILVCETGFNSFVDPAIVSMSKAATSPQQNQHLLSTDLTSAGGLTKQDGRHSSRSLSPSAPLLPGFQNRAPGAGRRDSHPSSGGGGGGGGRQQQQQQSHQQHQQQLASMMNRAFGAGFGVAPATFAGAVAAQHAHAGPPAHPLHRPYSRRDEDVESVEDVRSRNSFNRENNFMRPPGRGGSRMAADFSRGGQRNGAPGIGTGGGGGLGYGGNRMGAGGGGGFVPRNFGGHHRGGPGGGHHQSSGDRRRFDSDYDFEKANEKFQESLGHLKDEFAKAKIDVTKQDTSGDVTPKQQQEYNLSGSKATIDSDDSLAAKHAYDRTKSFFDNISCEALENMEGKNSKPNRRREREINQETFGMAGGAPGGPGGGGRPFQYRRGLGGPGAAGGGGRMMGYHGMRGGGGGGFGGGPRRGGGGGQLGHDMGGGGGSYNRYR